MHGTFTAAALALAGPLGRAQALDLLFAVTSFALFTAYHAWYYSWHLWGETDGPTAPSALAPAPPALAAAAATAGDEHVCLNDVSPVVPRHRLDMTGQYARKAFTEAVLATGSDQDFNMAVQTMRNPITAASILATGATVGVTTLANLVLDAGKMAVVREWGQRDPLTGGSGVIGPEAKLGCAVGALFLSFFSMAQALRLFVHYPFLIRAASYCRASGASWQFEGLARDAVRTCLRGQTFFSLGLRFFYAFIPLIFWVMGGTWLLVATAAEVSCLYVLDQL